MKNLLFLFASVVILSVACNNDPCEDVTCENGGTCFEGGCECTFEYTGTNCTDEQRTVYYGDYAGTAMTSFGPLPDTVKISERAGSVTGFTIDDAALLTYMLGQGIEGELTTATEMSVPNQTATGVTYSGSGTFNGNDVNIILTVEIPGSPLSPIDVTFNGTKL